MAIDMKRLTLVRHAKSSWKDRSLSDFERPLNKRGKHDAPMMGERLVKLKFVPDLILSSPAKRAIKTARVIADAIGYPEKKILEKRAVYDADRTTLVQIIQALDDKLQHVMLFGHNPTFTYLANDFIEQHIENIPTCGIVCIDFDVQSWSDISPGKGRLVFFDYPKNPDSIRRA